MDLFAMIYKKINKNLFGALTKENINLTNKSKMSLLHMAIAHKNDDAAIELINRDIDLSLRDDKRQTVLHYTGFYNNRKIGELILQRYLGLSGSDNYGNSPLWYAVFSARGNYETVKLFIENGADPFIKNNNNKTPIDFAKQIDDNELVTILLNKPETTE